jgi:hypothetical protein
MFSIFKDIPEARIRILVLFFLLSGLTLVPAGGRTAADRGVTAVFSAGVSDVFEIKLDTGTVEARTGQVRGASQVTVRNNTGSRYFLKIKYAVAVPGSTLDFRCTGGGGDAQESWTAVSTADQGAYASAAAERNNLPDGTQLQFDYRIAEGKGAWAVTYTLCREP